MGGSVQPIPNTAAFLACQEGLARIIVEQGPAVWRVPKPTQNCNMHASFLPSHTRDRGIFGGVFVSFHDELRPQTDLAVFPTSHKFAAV